MDLLRAHWFEGMSEHVTAEAGSAEWHEAARFLADVPRRYHVQCDYTMH